jgi:hypothetical protein
MLLAHCFSALVALPLPQQAMFFFREVGAGEALHQKHLVISSSVAKVSPDLSDKLCRQYKAQDLRS